VTTCGGRRLDPGEVSGVLLEVQGLSRYYGSLAAVNGISFSIDRGEIVGLLGPNGAGKTTTMRMLTCFLPPSEGTARVAGHDIMDEPMEVRRHLGYMPENNPLYGEMRTEEYLRFRAELKGVPRRRRTQRVGRCMELCGVAEVRRQVIRTLSKGYRQRVGLADALLGDPDVLILDEPTIGLDPNQIRQTRATIRQLSERHTILLSTHILQEVEAICERALIIDRGKIVADDTLEGLSEATVRRAVKAEMKGDADQICSALRRLDGVQEVSVTRADAWNTFHITASEGQDVREAVYALAARSGWPLRELTMGRATLEDVFHRITRQAESENE